MNTSPCKTCVTLKIRELWDIAPYSLVGVDRRFRRAYCLKSHICNTISTRMLLPRFSGVYLLFLAINVVQPEIMGCL
jgi:hypothetical protein